MAIHEIIATFLFSEGACFDVFHFICYSTFTFILLSCATIEGHDAAKNPLVYRYTKGIRKCSFNWNERAVIKYSGFISSKSFFDFT